jgi:hypothetical protein
MTNPEIDRRVYELAKDYLLGIPGINQTLIEKYQNLPSFSPKPESKNELYKRLLCFSPEC